MKKVIIPVTAVAAVVAAIVATHIIRSHRTTKVAA